MVKTLGLGAEETSLPVTPASGVTLDESLDNLRETSSISSVNGYKTAPSSRGGQEDLGS